jgi:myo-inositol-1(or 4)-monophosphatase
MSIDHFIQKTILQAGRISLEYRLKLSTIRIDRKSTKDLVTEADMAVEQHIISNIKNKYPDHSILAEESGSHAGNDYLWIIDPIDGTTSFIHGHPSYSISIALQKNARTTHAAVYAPVTNELFTAELHKGARLNDAVIHVSDRSQLSDCLFNTGFACLRSNWRYNNLPHLNKVAPRVRGIRMSGSAALDLAYVACGRSDGAWELNLNIYDVAAGMLLVSEAGGIVSDFHGQPHLIPSEVLACNSQIHSQMVELFSDSSIGIYA